MSFLFALAFCLVYPPILFYFQPFAISICSAISSFSPRKAACIATFQGCIQDIVFSSPRFGLCPLSSLFSSISTNIIFRRFSSQNSYNLPYVIIFSLCEIIYNYFLTVLYLQRPVSFSFFHLFTYVSFSFFFAILYHALMYVLKKKQGCFFKT